MFEKLKALKMLYRRFIPLKKNLGYCGKNSIIEYPVWFESKNNVFIEENVIVRDILLCYFFRNSLNSFSRG